MINFLTTVIGLLTIIYASFLIYVKPNFASTDYLVLVVTGMFLIWFKDSSAKDVIERLLNTKINSKQNENLQK